MTDVLTYSQRHARSDARMNLLASDRVIQALANNVKWTERVTAHPTQQVNDSNLARKAGRAYGKDVLLGSVTMVSGFTLWGLSIAHVFPDYHGQSAKEWAEPIGGIMVGTGITTVALAPFRRTARLKGERMANKIDNAADSLLRQRKLPSIEDFAGWYNLDQESFEKVNDEMQDIRTKAVLELSPDTSTPLGYTEAYTIAANEVWDDIHVYEPDIADEMTL